MLCHLFGKVNIFSQLEQPSPLCPGVQCKKAHFLFTGQFQPDLLTKTDMCFWTLVVGTVFSTDTRPVIWEEVVLIEVMTGMLLWGWVWRMLLSSQNCMCDTQLLVHTASLPIPSHPTPSGDELCWAPHKYWDWVGWSQGYCHHNY